MAVKKPSTVTIAATGATGAAQEDGVLVATGHLSATDSDPAATIAWSLGTSGTGVYGTLVLDPDGTWTYSVNNAAAKVQALAAGKTVTENFTIKATDSNGNAATKVVSVTITGAEDLPVISFVAGQNLGAVQEDTTLKATGTLTGKDVDTGAVLAWSVLGNATGTYGSMAVVGGKWTYTLANTSAAVQSLAQGQHAAESFTLQLADGQGGFAQQVITLDILGKNDAPVIAATGNTTTGSVKEDTTLSATGVILASDVDKGSLLGWTVVGGGTGTYGSLAVDQTGHWTYSLANAAANVQALNTGKSVTDSFTVQVADGLGGVASKAVTITVAGTNEPVVAAPPKAVADTTAGTENQVLTINALANDTGTGVTIQSASVPTGSGSLSVVAGKLVFDPGTAFDHLAQGATASVAGSYTIRDTAGTTSTAAVTITVTGTNDAATVGAALTLAANEDAAPKTLNLLTGALDVDDGAVLHLANVTGLAAGVTVAGSTLSLDAANAGFQHLAQGTQAVVTVGYNVLDQFNAGAAQTATITVTGVNDAATVGAALTLAATEDAAPNTLNLLTGAQDADDGAVLHVANLTGLVAGVTLSGSTLTVDPADASFQHLAAGETQVLTLHYDVLDQFNAGAAQTATITITGSNDGPVVAAALTASATQGDAAFTVDLLAGASDADTNDVLHVANVVGLDVGLSLTGDTLTLDPSSAAFQALLSGQHALLTVTFDVVDGHGGVVAQTLDIDILGIAPPPVGGAIAGDVAGTTSEDATQADGSVVAGLAAASGALSVSGADPAATWDWSGSLTGQYGSFSIDATTGAWSYNLDNGTAEPLTASDHITETFTVTATDGLGNSLYQDVTVQVDGANDAPVAQYNSFSASNGAETPLDLIGTGTTYDSDNGDVLTLTGASIVNGAGGSVSIVNNQVVFNPGTDFASLTPGASALVQVSYTVQDSAGATSTNTIDVSVMGQDQTYTPGVKYGPFTVIDASTAAAHGAEIAAAVLGNTPQGLSFDAGSLSLTAGAASAMYYDGSLAPLGIGAGILITSGSMPGLGNTVGWFGQDNAMAGSTALDTVVNTVFNTVSYDATTLSFSFTVTDASITGISFKAIFGTDEYPEWVDQFVDIAVVMVNGVNVALFNNDPLAPLSVIGSNLAANYFIDNTGNIDPATGQAIPGMASLLPIEYDGVSHLLNISAPVHMGVNTISIAISDTGDHIYDSGLFISALAATTIPGGGVSLPVDGTLNDDSLTGSLASETIDAKAGNDSIDAGGGNDTVLAGDGDDDVSGGAGNDYIDGGSGANTAIYAGNAADYHISKLANGHYSVEDLRNASPDGLDDLVSVQSLTFANGTYAITSFDSVVPPPVNGVTINGTADDDVINATTSPAGQPLLTDVGDLIIGNDGDDIVVAGAGADTILGGAKNDQLSGGGGNDLLDGGTGHDELTGGSGADTFRFTSAADAPTNGGHDDILDFRHADGDVIDFSQISSGSGVALVFLGVGTSFSSTAGELIATKGGDGYLVEGDLDGDGVADFAVQVATSTKLIATDFLL